MLTYTESPGLWPPYSLQTDNALYQNQNDFQQLQFQPKLPLQQPNYHAFCNYPANYNQPQPLQQAATVVFYPGVQTIKHSGLHPGYTSPVLPTAAPTLFSSRTSSISTDVCPSPGVHAAKPAPIGVVYQKPVPPQYHYLNKVWRSDAYQPTDRQANSYTKVKLPPISEFTNFSNIKPGKYRIKQSAYSVMKPTPALKTLSSPVTKGKVPTKDKVPTKGKASTKGKVSTKGKSSTKIKKVSSRIKYEISPEKPTPKFFNKIEITKSFLMKNMKRDIGVDRFQLDTKIPSHEVVITDNDILRYKLYTFLFDHMNMHDLRAEYKRRKEQGRLDNYLGIRENCKFIIKISVKLQDAKLNKDTGKFQNKGTKGTKRLQATIFLAKPRISQLTKSDILRTLQLHFNHFTLSRDTEAPLPKPNWGLGSRDELTVFELSVNVK